MTTLYNNLAPVTPGDNYSIDHFIKNLNAPITQAKIAFKTLESGIVLILPKTITTTPVVGVGVIISTGIVQPNGTYTAEVRFDYPQVDTAGLVPGITLWYFIDCQTTLAAGYTSEVQGTLMVLSGGPLG